MNDDDTNPLDLESQYCDMASDTTREREAEEWIEGLIADAPENDVGRTTQSPRAKSHELPS